MKPTRHISLRLLSGIVGALAIVNVGAQQVLPFPPTPSASTPGLTMQDSVHQKRVSPPLLPKDARNILIILIADVGPAVGSTYGGDLGSPVSIKYYDDAPFKFNGTIGTTKIAYPKK